VSRAPTTTMSGLSISEHICQSYFNLTDTTCIIRCQSMDGGYLFDATSADLRGGKAKEVLDMRSRDILCGCGYQEFDDCVRIR